MQEYGLTSYPVLPSTLPPLLSQTGFTNIKVVTKKIPISPWARDPNLVAPGVLAKEWVGETIDAMMAKPLEAFGCDLKTRKAMATSAKQSLELDGVNRYLKVNFVLAQREIQAPVVMSDSESYMSLGP